MFQYQGVGDVLAMAVIALLKMVEAVLYVLMDYYEHWFYYPLQRALWPAVAKIPRTITVDGRTITVFTANKVTWSRTLLVLPIAVSLKYNYYWTGACLVAFHDFLDHLDGIVAKVHREKFGPIDDPTLGGFMDAFCDKIVNGLTLWTVLVVTDFSHMTDFQAFVYAFSCFIIIAYEFVLGVVRVQDYFKAHYLRKLRPEIFNQIDSSSSKASTAAGMAGKLKEKLESTGMAALCVSQASDNPLLCVSGVLGVTCLYLSIRLAHTSLMSKINARTILLRSKAHASDDEDEKKVLNSSAAPEMTQGSAKDLVTSSTQTVRDCSEDEEHNNKICTRHGSPSYGSYGLIKTYIGNDIISDKASPDLQSSYSNKDEDVDNNESAHLHRCFSLPGTEIYNDAILDTRAERVYTIGCFDLFHHGHVTLLKRMKGFAKKVVVGVHDSRSIYQLKNRVPIDSTVTRMRNVKQHADEVFCVAGTDPAPFIDAIFDRENTGRAIYIRGDDMPNFPARNLCEKLMTIKFLPYTAGVSSTKIRKNLFNSNHYDLRPDDGDIMFY